MAAEDSIIEYQISLAGDRNTCNNELSHSTVAETCSQVPDRSSFLLFPNTNFSENLSENASMQETTPERQTCVEVCGTGAELSSVNSHSQKRRKLIDSQWSSCNKMVQLSSLDAESCCQAGNIRSISRFTNEVTGSPHLDTSSKSNFQKPIQTICSEIQPGTMCLLSDQTTEKMLNICCLICKNSLGIADNDYLVPCSLTTSSKSFAAYILENGPLSTCISQELLQNHGRNINVAITDVSSVNQCLFKTHVQGAQQHDTWSEEDGCVFRILFCPFCVVSTPTCLGLQIMAADSTNIPLINKVV
ncbi:hypothetical protein DsansV1_C15g0135071 [Dioscorea sansibarensis]